MRLALSMVLVAVVSVAIGPLLFLIATLGDHPVAVVHVRWICGTLALGGVAMATGYHIVGRMLRSLNDVTATARRLSLENLDERIGYQGPDDEVAELAKTFDDMLDRLATTVDSQRRFVANASHELRTPLAVICTEVDVTLSDPDADADEYRRMAGVVRDAAMRANAMIESLLLLARTNDQARQRQVRQLPVDLGTGVTRAMSAIGAEADRLNLTVQAQLDPAPVMGDPALLERLAGNLIENAVHYNHLTGSVWVRTWCAGDDSFLLVGNTGLRVEPDEVSGLFEPFRRTGPDRTGCRGAGLGLSIVQAVCEVHGGTVRATARQDGGLEVTVRLPRSRQI